MKAWLVLVVSFFISGFSSQPKVYDCFTFFNELDLLKWRLEELYDAVDYFVLVESEETFQGASKRLYFNENKHLFAKFLDKIRHVIVPKIDATSPWTKEGNQRDSILQGLYDASPCDVVLVSDVDEIFRASRISEIVERLCSEPRVDDKAVQKMSTQQRVDWTLKNLDLLIHPEMYEACFFVNRYSGKMRAPYATLFYFLLVTSPDHLRSNRDPRIGCNPYITAENTLKEGGWHFTSLGGHEKWITKLESFAHVEGDTEENKSWKHYLYEVGIRTRIPIDSSFPLYIQNHREELVMQSYIDIGQFEWLR